MTDAPRPSDEAAVGQSATVSVDHYENFPVASWLCPPHLRGAIHAIYRFARCADDLADEGDADSASRLASLARFRAALEAISRRETVADVPEAWTSIFTDLQGVIERHRLPVPLLRALLDAFEQDVRNPTYADRVGLLDYCSRSANPVGRLLLHLYAIDDSASLHHSDAICSALQLINFWQDLSVDGPRHRIYVPRSDLERHGLDSRDLRGEDTPASRLLVADLCGWARGLMLEGAPLAHRVPGRAGWELRLVVQGGLRILDKIADLDHAVLRRRPALARSDAVPMAWRALTMRASSRSTSPRHDLAR